MRAFLLALFLVSSPVLAMTVPVYTEAQLRAGADVVVEGVVATMQTRRVGTRIVTFVSIISGAAPRLTTTLVALPGGEFGGFTQVVPGSPVLEVGRRYRLYLTPADGPRLDDTGSRARGIFAWFRGTFLLDDVGGEAVPFGDDGRPVGLR